VYPIRYPWRGPSFELGFVLVIVGHFSQFFCSAGTDRVRLSPNLTLSVTVHTRSQIKIFAPPSVPKSG
jgi:hypothetical protein